MNQVTEELSLPDQALAKLKAGNERFINNVRINRDFTKEVEATKDKQEPFAVIISCMDSRNPPELVFDQGIGDVFSIRIAGNIITPEVIGSCEYACQVVGASLVLVLGHRGCGAIQGAINNVRLGHLHTILNRINHNVHLCSHDLKIKDADIFTLKNVECGVQDLAASSEVLRNLVETNKLKIIGGIYDVADGTVSFL